jgi:hypothetical protein
MHLGIDMLENHGGKHLAQLASDGFARLALAFLQKVAIRSDHPQRPSTTRIEHGMLSRSIRQSSSHHSPSRLRGILSAISGLACVIVKASGRSCRARRWAPSTAMPAQW